MAKSLGNRSWHGGKIFVVEDNHLQAEVVSDFLRDCGLEPVGPAGRLAEACQLAQERPLDGALLDVKLRENLCFPVCTILRARKIPFILLTGHRQSSLIPPELCVAPLLCKPFREDDLAAALALILNRRVSNRNSADVAEFVDHQTHMPRTTESWGRDRLGFRLGAHQPARE